MWFIIPSTALAKQLSLPALNPSSRDLWSRSETSPSAHLSPHPVFHAGSTHQEHHWDGLHGSRAPYSIQPTRVWRRAEQSCSSSHTEPPGTTTLGGGTHHTCVHLVQATKHSHMPSLLPAPLYPCLPPCPRLSHPQKSQFQQRSLKHVHTWTSAFCKHCSWALARAPASLLKDSQGLPAPRFEGSVLLAAAEQCVQPEASKKPTFYGLSEQKALDHITRESPLSPVTLCRAPLHLCVEEGDPALHRGWERPNHSRTKLPLLSPTSLPTGRGSPVQSPRLQKHPPGSELRAALRNALKWLKPEEKAQARGMRRCRPHSEEAVGNEGWSCSLPPTHGQQGEAHATALA
ncbi:uncharacterized protein LOC127475583 [Manacus candei]|uniref:uncharacterized protein LOC127475583 n=1 Tax=Manacus candei TaxID=415023 RepID=UPI002227A3EE|nr:uncharacterized protein LOC127475583 [Manacus candei]